MSKHSTDLQVATYRLTAAERAAIVAHQELIAVVGSDSRPVAFCGPGPYPLEQVTADACLFAAAPDMAAALEQILAEPYGCRFCDSGTLRKPNNPAKCHDDDCGYAMAVAALAKARIRDTEALTPGHDPACTCWQCGQEWLKANLAR